ncbi:MAG: tRNA (N6-threonylcarbamoyladenosine(37)-N6)-methyltransferase TrmO [Dehalococcoidia bacterium]
MNQSHNSTGGIQMKPVGLVRNQWKEPRRGGVWSAMGWRERARRTKEQVGAVSELVIDESLEEALGGIDDFSHIMVLYWAHLTPPERQSTIKVHPMGNEDFPLVGVFATHSPVRPNPILTTVVQVIERRGNVIRVTGLDALDGSPILDIKPYIPDHRDLEDIRMPDWMREIGQEFDEH